MKGRLSKNQRDTLFVLACLENRGRNNMIPVMTIKKMIDQSRPTELDPTNFRKGIRTLANRGFLDMHRAPSLELSIKLNRNGRHLAAPIYRDRTGQELDVMPHSGEQSTIFDAMSA